MRSLELDSLPRPISPRAFGRKVKDRGRPIALAYNDGDARWQVQFGGSAFVGRLGRPSWSAILVESHPRGRHRQRLPTKLGDSVPAAWTILLCRQSLSNLTR